MKRVAMNVAVLAALLATGCQGEHTDPNYEFPDAGKMRSYQQMANVQRSAGARADGNLYAYHFTDDSLNSLGRAKVDAMIRNDESVRPVTIYMATAADQTVNMRRIESVTAYLKDNGLTESQMRFETGANAATYHAAAPDLANLSKTDSGQAPGADGAAAEEPAMPTSGGYGTSGTIMK
jgi:hypothetical protein